MRVQDYQIAGYAYRAAEYCPVCAVRAVLAHERLEGHGLSYVPDEALDLMARFRGIERGNESSFDSDDFPKVIFGYQAEDAESVCDTCGGALTSIDAERTWETARETEDAA